jgi:hypothetical protein
MKHQAAVKLQTPQAFRRFRKLSIQISYANIFEYFEFLLVLSRPLSLDLHCKVRLITSRYLAHGRSRNIRIRDNSDARP